MTERTRVIGWTLLGIAMLTVGTLLASVPNSGSPLTVSAEAHGIRITVTLPRRAYRPGSILTATVRLTASARTAVTLNDYPWVYGGSNPAIIVVTPTGQPYHASYAPHLPPGPAPRPFTLRSGRTLTRQITFPLERPWIVGQVNLLPSPHPGVRRSIAIRTPVLRVPTQGNAVRPLCHANEGYRPGYCIDPPDVLSVGPMPGSNSNLFGSRAQHRTYGSIVVKAAIGNPMINDEVPQFVYGQLLVHGRPIAQLQMTATWHYRNGNKVCRPRSNARGTAVCSEPPLALGTQDLQRVVVDVGFSYHGRHYMAQTSYRASND